MSRLPAIFLVCLLFLLNSCSGDRVFEEFKPFESGVWLATDSINFELNEVEVSNRKSLLAIRFNETYKFSNCYVRIICQDSLNTILENRLINMPLFDSKSGKPLGKGFGNSLTKYDTVPFDLDSRTKKVTLLQYMREDQLSGIEAIGLKILK